MKKQCTSKKETKLLLGLLESHREVLGYYGCKNTKEIDKLLTKLK